MRVTKEPEVRKQEILDTALKLFGENGYEKTSMTDIAKAIGVAQGLCYRYFPSKEALFDSALEQYADILVEQFVGSEKDDHKTLRQIIEDMPSTMEERDTKYYSAFHGIENKNFTINFLSKYVRSWFRSLKNCCSALEIREKSTLMIYGQLRCFAYMGSLVSCWQTI